METVAVITLKTVHHMQIRIKFLVLYRVDMVIKTVLIKCTIDRSLKY